MALAVWKPAIVELELHQRIFETDWRILPVSQQLGKDHE